MQNVKRFRWFARRQRARYRRLRRLLFMSPAEAQFVRIIGGRTITIDGFVSRQTGFPFTIVTSMGGHFGRYSLRREVRIGRYWVDFANVERKLIIEIDGFEWHRDITKEQERDDYLEAEGWTVLHINAGELFTNRSVMLPRILRFLTR